MVLRFGNFELDRTRYQLRRNGKVVRLERIPMELLLLLAERRGELVGREEILGRVWGTDTYLETDSSINTAMRKVRQALGDNAEKPAFIETVTGKGYRFVAKVTEVSGPETSLMKDGEPGALALPCEPPVAAAQSATHAQMLLAGNGFGTPADLRSRRILLGALAAMSAVGAAAFLVGRNGRRVTVAVLPFENLSSDREQEYFVEGLEEETVTVLGGLNPEEMRVIARSSTRIYRKQERDLAEISQALGADYLLEGSVRREGERVRLTVKLIRASDRTQVWAKSFDRSGAGVIEIQEELGNAIAQQIHITVAASRTTIQRQTRDPAAFEFYLLGRHYSERPAADSNRKAIHFYQAAIDRDPRYALAWAGLSAVYSNRAISSDADTRESLPVARQAAAQSQRLDPTLAEGHMAVARVNFWMDWKWGDARRGLEYALELKPNDAPARRMLAHVLSNSGLHAEADRAITGARELDPLSAYTLAIQGQVLFQARRYDQAWEPLERAIRLEPNFWIPHVILGKILERGRQFESASISLDRADALAGGSTEPISIKGWVMARSGRTSEARQILRSLEDRRNTVFVPPYNLALIHFGLGNVIAAMDWLEQAYDVRDVRLVFLPVDPKWDEIRGHPRFRDLVARCGFSA